MHTRQYQKQPLFCSDFFLFSSYFALFPHFFDTKDSPDVAASLFHYPVLSALLHQLGQKHNLVEVALDLDLALCDCNLRDQLAADNFFDIGQ